MILVNLGIGVHDQHKPAFPALAEYNPPFIIRAMVFIRPRERERIMEDRHRLLEGNPVLGEIALGLRRVPIELEAHGSELAAKGAVLEGGEEGVEVNKVVMRAGF